MAEEIRNAALEGMTVDERRSLALLDVAPRPDKGGTAGRPIKLVANTYLISINGADAGGARPQGAKQAVSTVGRPVIHGTVWHYDIDIEAASGPRPSAGEGGEGDKPRQRRGTVADKDRGLPKALRRAIFLALLEQHVAEFGGERMTGSLAFDGMKSAYTARKLGFASKKLTVTLPERDGRPPRPGRAPRAFEVKVDLVNEIDLDVLGGFCSGDRRAIGAAGAAITEKVTTAIQALDVLFKEEPSKIYKVHGAQGRRFFDPKLAVPLPNGAEIWKGFFQSVRPAAAGLVVNIDVAFSAFMGGGDFRTVAAKILGMDGGGGGGGGFRGGRGGGRGGPPPGRGGRGGGRGGYGGGGGGGGGGYGGGGPAPQIQRLDERQKQELRKRLFNVQIRVTHRQTTKTETFKGFTPQLTRELSFSDADGNRVTLIDYFKKKYNYTIRCPDLPCVKLGSGNTFVPPECCEIVPGTPIPPLKLNPAQIEGMIRESAQRPNDRNNRVQEIRRSLRYETDQRLASWGVAVEARQLEVTGRVLPPPTISYAGNRTARANNGGWNLVGMKFNKPGRDLVTWAVVNFSRQPVEYCQRFVEAQVQQLRATGLVVRNDRPPIHQGVYDQSRVTSIFHDAGRDAYQRAKAAGGPTPPPQLFLVILDQQDQGFYDQIKRTCALSLATPVPSQCVNTRKAFQERGQQQYCGNLAMKINVKLGGFNQTVTPRDLPGVTPSTMIIGVDATHAPAGSLNPSIAASVGTKDGNRTKWTSELRTQRNVRGGAQEVILDAQSMFSGHLKRWTGAPPTSIIVFRDGVSEGQYFAVVDQEVQALKNACRALRPDYSPKITYIVCAKRHHIRFNAVNPQDNDGRSQALPAGTVVDTHVVHPFAADIYLQAQGGLVGTPRPTHYVMLRDDNGFSSDNFAQMINSLSYTFARATRSTALVAPALYADILCEKGRGLVWTEGSDIATTISGDDGRSTSSGDIDTMQIMRTLERSTEFVESQWYL